MMKWSLKLGRLAGIDVYVHLTFLLFLAFIGVSAYLSAGTVLSVVDSIVYLLALFGCVLLHEFGHALAARQFGIPTRDITLYPMGGVARLERMPEKPVQELWVALAGPLVNVVIALVLFGVLAVTGGLNLRGDLLEGSLLQRLMVVNVSLIIFNLIPAFPMDGGRVLRALLATQLNYARATRMAATLGQGLALLFGLAGFFFNPMLVVVAIFVWSAAGQEADMVQMKAALTGVPVNRAMLTDFRTLHPLEPVARVLDYMMVGAQQDFPVVVEGQVVGVLSRADVFEAVAQRGPVGMVGHLMRRDFPQVGAHDMLEPVLARLQTLNQRVALVIEQGRLVGLLTSEQIGRFLMLQSLMGARRPA